LEVDIHATYIVVPIRDELPERFDDPIACEMFGLDAVKHGPLLAVIARRMAR
jgi:hypothetical protein